jgi:hypothetical protein
VDVVDTIEAGEFPPVYATDTDEVKVAAEPQQPTSESKVKTQTPPTSETSEEDNANNEMYETMYSME